MSWAMSKIILLAILAYAATCGSCDWFYSSRGLDADYAILFSVDTITCSARYPITMPRGNNPKDILLPRSIRNVAAGEALLGHLGFPLLLAALIAGFAGAEIDE
jgi:hypothetical protein